MPNLNQLSQGVSSLFNRPAQPDYGTPPLPQGAPQLQASAPVSYPPAPAVKHQSKPTEMSMSDLKYNAFNVDQLKFQITGKRGFDGVTPDLVIWNQYQYKVTELKANAEENELSGYVSWAMQEKNIQDVKIDFHPGNRVSISGKYPLLGIPLPFTAEVQVSVTPLKQMLLTVDQFRTGFAVPNRLRDALLDVLVSDTPSHGPAGPGVSDAFSIPAALRKVSPNQILVDFGRMPTPLNLPINSVETSETGVTIIGGSGK